MPALSRSHSYHLSEHMRGPHESHLAQGLVLDRLHADHIGRRRIRGRAHHKSDGLAMSDHAAPPYAPAAPAAPPAIQPVYQPDPDEPGRVILTDIRISFVRLVFIMIKVALAAIPASIIVALIYGALALFVFSGFIPRLR